MAHDVSGRRGVQRKAWHKVCTRTIGAIAKLCSLHEGHQRGCCSEPPRPAKRWTRDLVCPRYQGSWTLQQIHRVLPAAIGPASAVCRFCWTVVGGTAPHSMEECIPGANMTLRRQRHDTVALTNGMGVIRTGPKFQAATYPWMEASPSTHMT